MFSPSSWRQMICYPLTIAPVLRSTWLRSRAGGGIDQVEERLTAHGAYIQERRLWAKQPNLQKFASHLMRRFL